MYPRPTDIDRSLNEVAADKIHDYRGDYNNRPSNAIDFMSAVATTSGRPIQPVPLPSRDVLLPVQIESRQHTSQD